MQSESIRTSRQTSVKRPNHPKKDWFHKPGSNLKQHEVGFTPTGLATQMQYECGSNSCMRNNPRGPKIAIELHTSVLQQTITKNADSPSAAPTKKGPRVLESCKIPAQPTTQKENTSNSSKNSDGPGPLPKETRVIWEWELPPQNRPKVEFNPTQIGHHVNSFKLATSHSNSD
jgi:hypothetical protein